MVIFLRFAYLLMDDGFRKILTERSQVAKVPNCIEILPKISIAWVGRTNERYRWQTDRWWHIANVASNA